MPAPHAGRTTCSEDHFVRGIDPVDDLVVLPALHDHVYIDPLWHRVSLLGHGEGRHHLYLHCLPPDPITGRGVALEASQGLIVALGILLIAQLVPADPLGILLLLGTKDDGLLCLLLVPQPREAAARQI